MRLNTQPGTKKTHEGAPAKNINALEELKRTVSACLLWENQFYEDGKSIADRICELVKQNKPQDVSDLAIHARTNLRLRHVPLLLARELTRVSTGKIVGHTITNVIQRADELAEFLAIYWKDGKQPLSSQVKLGLANAWTKFNAYQLAKYNRDGQVKLRDSLFLCHAKPKDKVQEATWKKLVNGTLEAPDTWEVNLSTGGDKKESFERLLTEKKLGYMALLRNLRNMKESGVNEDLVFSALIEGAGKSKALPFRYISAAKAVPQWEPAIDEAMKLSMGGMDKLKGKTVVLVDVSGSMDYAKISARSELTRREAAAALAALVAGIADKYEVYTFAENVNVVPSRQGMALIDAIMRTSSGCTYLGAAVKQMNTLDYDRLIVITDEQSHDPVGGPKFNGYMINVASSKNGVGYGPWTHIDGFSESVINYIREIESCT